MAEPTLDDILDVPFTLKPRPIAISSDLRPARRVALLVLILEHCREMRANLEQLHVLNWALRNEESRRDFADFLNGKRAPDRAVVRYDPSLSRVIAIALAMGLVLRNEHQKQLPLEGMADAPPKVAPTSQDYRISLSDRGKELAKILAGQEGCLAVERAFLKKVGRKITQQLIHHLLYWGTP